MRGRAAAGLTNTDPYPRQQQLQIILRQTADRRHKTPDKQRQRDDVAAITAIRPAGNGNTGSDVKQGESEPGQQTQLAVTQAQIGLDRLLQNGQQLAVDKVKGVYQSQNAQGIPGATVGTIGCHVLLFLLC